MSETKPKFTLVDDAQPGAAAAQAGMRMILAGLHTLSLKALTAISSGFSLVLVGAVWALAYHVLDNPSPNQIGTVLLFAVFCILIDIIRRRTK